MVKSAQILQQPLLSQQQKQPDLAAKLKRELGLSSGITLKRITKPNSAAAVVPSSSAVNIIGSTIISQNAGSATTSLPKLSYHGPPPQLPTGVPQKFLMPMAVGSISLTPLGSKIDWYRLSFYLIWKYVNREFCLNYLSFCSRCYDRPKTDNHSTRQTLNMINIRHN